MLENEKWLPNNSPMFNIMKILCLGSNTRRYFDIVIRIAAFTISELKVAVETGEDMGHFLQVQLTKLSRAVKKLDRVCEW